MLILEMHDTFQTVPVTVAYCALNVFSKDIFVKAPASIVGNEFCLVVITSPDNDIKVTK